MQGDYSIEDIGFWESPLVYGDGIIHQIKNKPVDKWSDSEMKKKLDEISLDLWDGYNRTFDEFLKQLEK